MLAFEGFVSVRRRGLSAIEGTVKWDPQEGRGFVSWIFSHLHSIYRVYQMEREISVRMMQKEVLKIDRVEEGEIPISAKIKKVHWVLFLMSSW